MAVPPEGNAEWFAVSSGFIYFVRFMKSCVIYARSHHAIVSALYGENGIGSEEFLGDSDVNVFVAKSLSLLEGEAPEVEEKAWNREETTWSLHGASVTCNGQGCTVCNGESCESFVLASEAFRYFLSNLGVAGQATFYELTFLKFRERLVIDVY